MQGLYQSRTLPEALGEVPGVLVQKTSNGQGSPFIRGFTGFRNVLLIDGIRLNNSVFRDGPNQYWNTVDTFAASRIEVLKGPASVLYGSDAIGGAVNVLSDIPGAAKPGFSPRALYRYSNAESSDTIRGDLTYVDDTAACHRRLHVQELRRRRGRRVRGRAAQDRLRRAGRQRARRVRPHESAARCCSATSTSTRTTRGARTARSMATAGMARRSARTANSSSTSSASSATSSCARRIWARSRTRCWRALPTSRRARTSIASGRTFARTNSASTSTRRGCGSSSTSNGAGPG